MTWAPKNKVIVPLDFSDDAFAAIDVAIDIAARPANVHLVHVLPELVMLDPSEVTWQANDDCNRIAQAERAMRQQLSADKFRDLPLKVLVGDPGHCIVDYAQEQGADLIVIPSHGRTGLARMLLGSVAERVVRLAHCPVLVLRK